MTKHGYRNAKNEIIFLPILLILDVLNTYNIRIFCHDSIPYCFMIRHHFNVDYIPLSSCLRKSKVFNSGLTKHWQWGLFVRKLSMVQFISTTSPSTCYWLNNYLFRNYQTKRIRAYLKKISYLCKWVLRSNYW